MKEILTTGFREAARDYFWLQEKAYPQRLLYKIVCDRYQLDSFQRVVLYRGIFPSSENSSRQLKKISSPQQVNLAVDTHNVVYRLCNYLCGRPVFICSDGLLRDAGDAFDKDFPFELLDRSLLLLTNYLLSLPLLSVRFLIDKPAYGSAQMHNFLAEKQAAFPYPASVEETYPADRLMDGPAPLAIATADSEIIDRLSCSYIDLPRLILDREFSPAFLSIPNILA